MDPFVRKWKYNAPTISSIYSCNAKENRDKEEGKKNTSNQIMICNKKMKMVKLWLGYV